MALEHYWIRRILLRVHSRLQVNVFTASARTNEASSSSVSFPGFFFYYPSPRTLAHHSPGADPLQDPALTHHLLPRWIKSLMQNLLADSLLWPKRSRGGHSKEQLSNSSRSIKMLRQKPLASEILTCHLMSGVPWTSYFVKYSSLKDDQWGQSSFNWEVNGRNYRILRTGCWPYIKYHCTQGPAHDLSIEDAFFRFIKVLNLGIPCLAYGLAATLLIRHMETVSTPHGPVTIYFLYEEDKGSLY